MMKGDLNGKRFVELADKFQLEYTKIELKSHKEIFDFLKDKKTDTVLMSPKTVWMQ